MSITIVHDFLMFYFTCLLSFFWVRGGGVLPYLLLPVFLRFLLPFHFYFSSLYSPLPFSPLYASFLPLPPLTPFFYIPPLPSLTFESFFVPSFWTPLPHSTPYPLLLSYPLPASIHLLPLFIYSPPTFWYVVIVFCLSKSFAPDRTDRLYPLYLDFFPTLLSSSPPPSPPSLLPPPPTLLLLFKLPSLSPPTPSPPSPY